MRLLWNWKRVVRYSWSIRLSLIAALLGAAEFLVQFFMDDPPIPRGTFAVLGALVSFAAPIARVVMQQNLSGDEDE
jgi:hypothetical protein